MPNPPKAQTAFERFREVEPALWFYLIRALLYVAASATGAWFTPDNVEPILASLAALLSVDGATTVATRAKVTPVAKLKKEGT